MPRPRLTVSEYSAKYKVPKPTVYSWVRSKVLEADRFGYPMTIIDTGEVPVKDPARHGYRYIFEKPQL